MFCAQNKMTNTQLLSHVCFISCVVWELQPPSWNFELNLHNYLELRSKKKKTMIFGLFEKLKHTMKLMNMGALRQNVSFIWPYNKQ